MSRSTRALFGRPRATSCSPGFRRKSPAGDYFDALIKLSPAIDPIEAGIRATSNCSPPARTCVLPLGDWVAARNEYTDVLTRRQERRSPAYIDRARAAANLGDSVRVSKDLAEAIRLDPHAAEAQKEIEATPDGEPWPREPPPNSGKKLDKEARKRAPPPPSFTTRPSAGLPKSTGMDRIRYDEKYQERLRGP